MITIQTATHFFMWCTILNLVIFAFSSVMVIFCPDCIYNMNAKWFKISRESFDLIVYGWLGLYKIFFIMFSLVPYLALLFLK